MGVIGYKAFNADLTCRGFQYEIGKTYKMDGKPSLCDRGFHFCKTIADTYNFYPMSDNTRICKVEALGDIDEGDVKLCTNEIKILEEVTDAVVKKCNSNASSSGFLNTGDYNTGNRNTGDCNTGDCNTGDWNTGNRNTGDYNTGNRNTGDYNTGDYNTGDCNTGDWNSADRSTGVFNTKDATILMFNKPSGWTYSDWRQSDARWYLLDMPTEYTDIEFVSDYEMTDEEKKAHPEYVTIGGYLKKVHHEADVQTWWDTLETYKKDIIKALPNFDAEIFKGITGITV